MDEAIKLNQLPFVASLESSDTILISDSNGNGKRTNQSGALGKSVAYSTGADMGTGTWVRICEIGGESTGMVFINHRYHNNPSKGLILFYLGCHSTIPGNMMMFALGDTARFPSARVVHAPASYYLELKIKNLKEADYLRIATSGYAVNPVKTFTLGSVPEGYSVKEFDLTASLLGGG